MTMTASDLAELRPGLPPHAPRTFLNVGCGSAGPQRLPGCFREPGWEEIRLDINPAVRPDIVASMTDMGVVGDATVDAVWSSHNLEHLDRHEVVPALKEAFRVLKPGGFALITLPDIQRVASLVVEGKLEEVVYTAPAGPITALDMLFGHQASVARGEHYMAHRCGFDDRALARVLLEAGFEEVRVRKGQSYDLWAFAIKALETGPC